MELKTVLVILLFFSICFMLMLGFPVAFTLAGVSLIFGLIAMFVFDISMATAMNGFPQQILAIEQSDVLIAVPLFVFMGVMLERSKVAEELLDNMGRAFGPLRGGLAISVCVVGALLAASTGIIGATVVTMGLLSLPTMIRRGYSKQLACGTISASGTLGQIIPPSIVLVLLGDQLSTAYQRAQLAMGNFSPDTVSVNDLFAGALFPGLVLVGMYIVYIVIVAIVNPKAAPPIPSEYETGDRWGTLSGMLGLVALIAIGFVALGYFDVISYGFAIFSILFFTALLFGFRIDHTHMKAPLIGIAAYIGIVILDLVLEKSVGGNWLIVYFLLACAAMYGVFANAWREPFWRDILSSLIPPLVLIIAVLGSILTGLASPTEAAAVGAVGSIMLAGYRIDPKRSLPIIVGGISLVALLILTVKFDLRMQRNEIATGEWIAIIAALILTVGLIWGIVVGVQRTASHCIGKAGEVLRDANRERAWFGRVILFILFGVGLFALTRQKWEIGSTAIDHRWVVAIILSIGIVWALWAQLKGKAKNEVKGDSILQDVVIQTMNISAMVFVILIGARMFALVFRDFGGDLLVEEFLKNLPGGAVGAVLLVMVVMFLMGFILDFLEIVFIVVPIVAPILLQMSFGDNSISPVWLGVMMAVNLQTSYLTPPFGFALFYLRGVAPEEVKTTDIYRGIIPFVGIQLLALVVLWFLPGLATWLPQVIYGK